MHEFNSVYPYGISIYYLHWKQPNEKAFIVFGLSDNQVTEIETIDTTS